MDVIYLIMSMTGYGKDVQLIDGTTIHVEIKTLNNRFLDFSPSIPRSMLSIEEKVKKIIQSYFTRGSIDVYIHIEGTAYANKQVVTDWDLMDQYIDQVKKAKERYNLSGHIPIETMMTLSELFTIQETEVEQSDYLTEAIFDSVHRACRQVQTVRKKEGAFIAQDIRERIDSIQSTVLFIQKHQRVVIDQYRKRIHDRIKKQLRDYSQIEDARIQQEIILLAEKGDISEEIIRLLSHIEQFVSVIKESHAIGRKLDFIIQEMHREINTIGAKSMDTKISESIILLKSELEKVREQVQNIE